jgi:hypothetical protein
VKIPKFSTNAADFILKSNLISKII